MANLHHRGIITVEVQRMREFEFVSDGRAVADVIIVCLFSVFNFIFRLRCSDRSRASITDCAPRTPRTISFGSGGRAATAA